MPCDRSTSGLFTVVFASQWPTVPLLTSPIPLFWRRAIGAHPSDQPLRSHDFRPPPSPPPPLPGVYAYVLPALRRALGGEQVAISLLQAIIQNGPAGQAASISGPAPVGTGLARATHHALGCWPGRPQLLGAPGEGVGELSSVSISPSTPPATHRGYAVSNLAASRPARPCTVTWCAREGR